jgi:3-hydroxyisobutyrate dehydrogenase-like beta-hydroxyacid dehydrogenase
MDVPMRIGLVGLGLVGKALAGRFLVAGYRVLGYDVDGAACSAARDLRVEIAAELADVASCDLIVLSLPNSSIVDAVLWGEDGLGNACPEGLTLLDTTTANPSETEKHHRRLSERAVRFVDVPLVGSSQEIGEGKAVVLVGIPVTEADFAPVLDTFADRVFYFDAPGQGHRAKLVVNLVLGLNRLVLAEGLAFAEKQGMPLEGMLGVLKSGAAYSRVMDAKGDKMIGGAYEPPTARLAQHAKDVRLILELAGQSGAQTPVSELHNGLLACLIDEGLGGVDNAAIFEAFR